MHVLFLAINNIHLCIKCSEDDLNYVINSTIIKFSVLHQGDMTGRKRQRTLFTRKCFVLRISWKLNRPSVNAAPKFVAVNSIFNDGLR